MGCFDSTSNVLSATVKGQGPILKGDCSDGSHGGIVSLYRGIANRHLWVSEVNSQSANGGGGEGGEIPSNNTGQSHSPTCLPPVFALVRFIRSVPCVQPLDAPIRLSSGQSAGPTGGAIELGQDNGESESSRDVPKSSSCVDVKDIYDWKVTSLSAAWDQRYSSDTYIVCADTSSSSTALGWGMRNIFALLATHLPLTKTTASGQKEDRSVEGNSSSSLGASAAVADTEPSSEYGSGGRASCNIIALRGALAKRLYNCASRNKAVSFLNTLTDSQIGRSVHALLPCPFLLCPILPCPALPCPALPCPALPCPMLSCPTLPCPALPYPAMPCPTLPCTALSCLTVPCYALPYPALPYPAIPCPALSYPTLLCPVFSFDRPDMESLFIDILYDDNLYTLHATLSLSLPPALTSSLFNFFELTFHHFSCTILVSLTSLELTQH